MANNRMYLVHKPSGLGVYLGKRMGYGWYDAPEDLGVKMNDLFEECIGEGNQDDFAIVMENAKGLPHVTDKANTGNHDRSMHVLEFVMDADIEMASGRPDF